MSYFPRRMYSEHKQPRAARARKAPKKAAGSRRPARSGFRAPKRQSLGSRVGRAVDYAAPYVDGAVRLGSKIFGKVLGIGDYKISRNSLGGRDAVPAVHSMKDGVRIRHREFIQDISTSSSISIQSFDVNPGVAATFPWLAAIAQNFEQYRFEGLVVEFKSTASSAIASSTNLAMGTIVLAADYNASSAAFVNKQQMENAMWSTSVSPSDSCLMPIECAPQVNPMSNLYIRTGSVPSGQDQRLYDLCNVQVGAFQSQAAYVAGELWISYDVVLLKPVLSSGLNLSGQSAHYLLNTVTAATNPLGASQTLKYDSIGLSLSGTVLTFPLGSQGIYLISYTVTGTSASCVSPGRTLANATAAPTPFVGGTMAAVSNTGLTSTVFLSNYVISIADPTLQATVTYGTMGTLPTTATSADLVVTQLNANLV